MKTYHLNGGLLVLCITVLLAGCGGGDSAGDDSGGPASAPAAGDDTARPTGEGAGGLDALSGAMTDAAKKAEDATGAIAADVKTWFDGFDSRLEEYRTKVQTYKEKFSRTLDEDIKSLVTRADANIAEIEKTLQGFLTLSREEAAARKERLDQLFGEIDAVFKEIDQIRGVQPRG
jgi:hypothetical protein